MAPNLAESQHALTHDMILSGVSNRLRRAIEASILHMREILMSGRTAGLQGLQRQDYNLIGLVWSGDHCPIIMLTG